MNKLISSVFSLLQKYKAARFVLMVIMAIEVITIATFIEWLIYSDISIDIPFLLGFGIGSILFDIILFVRHWYIKKYVNNF